MTSNFIIKDQESFEPVSIVKCYYMKDNKKTVFGRLPNGKVICIPKTTIQSEFSRERNLLQDLVIDDWILRKFGLMM